MKELFEKENRRIEMYGPDGDKALPLVLFHAVEREGEALWNACRELNCPDFTLAVICDVDWERELSPWAAPAAFPGTPDFGGEADGYLQKLTGQILPSIEERLPQKPTYRVLAGYSLAGLFSLYAAFRTSEFKRILTASGSMWYPNFAEYAMSNPISPAVNRIYFSLGDREKRTRNPQMATVEEKTMALQKYFEEQGLATIFELNPGNHFKDSELRVAKGIRWILE